MDPKYQLPFKVGQTAEARCFKVGFRGAWFWCKIKEMSCRREHWSALLEYFDYPDEKWTWTQLYQVPPYQSGKSKEIRQLMLRPEYPPIHSKSKVSDVSSNSDVTIVVDGTWKTGDLVDWWSADSYWSGNVTKLLDNGKAEIELVPPLLGEVQLMKSSSRICAHPWIGLQNLVGLCLHPRMVKDVVNIVLSYLNLLVKDMLWVKGEGTEATTGLSSNSSFSSRLSGNLLPNEKRDFKATEFVERPLSVADSKEAANRSNDTLNQTASYASSSAHVSTKSLPALDEKSGSKSKELLEQFSNIADNTSKESIWSGSDSGSLIRDDASKSDGPTNKDLNYFHCHLKKFKTSGEIRLDSLESDTVEVAILELEELANKISSSNGLWNVEGFV